jgi:hypothetical protein
LNQEQLHDLTNNNQRKCQGFCREPWERGSFILTRPEWGSLQPRGLLQAVMKASLQKSAEDRGNTWKETWVLGSTESFLKPVLPLCFLVTWTNKFPLLVKQFWVLVFTVCNILTKTHFEGVQGLWYFLFLNRQ